VLLSLASGALAALALVQQIDTTVPAQQGQRLWDGRPDRQSLAKVLGCYPIVPL